MVAIIPAILPSSRQDLVDKLGRMHGIADEVQIDIVDGRFAAPPTWPYADAENGLAQGEMLPELAPFRYDVDLMVENPEDVIGSWVHGGACRITVHAETTRRLSEVVDDFSTKYGHDKNFAPGLLSFGLAINMATETSLIEPFLDRCDYVQFMGIDRIGAQGQPFDARVLQKVRSFHQKYPDMPIQIDGGVSVDTAPKLLEAGATRLVVGSAFMRSANPAETMRIFTEIAETRGLYA